MVLTQPEGCTNQFWVCNSFWRLASWGVKTPHRRMLRILPHPAKEINPCEIFWKQFLVSGFFSYWVRINGYCVCFRSCLTLFNFQGPPSLAVASLFKYAFDGLDNRHFAVAKPVIFVCAVRSLSETFSVTALLSYHHRSHLSTGFFKFFDIY